MGEWFHGERATRHPGTPGVFVILADTSGSMHAVLDQVEKATRQIMKEIPGARTFLFACDTKEFTGGYWPCNPGSTDIARAFSDIEHLRPAKTFLISDGGPDNEGKAFDAADAITGAIDSLFIFGDDYKYQKRMRDFMCEIARRSGGQAHERDFRRLSAGDLHRLMRQAAPPLPSQPIAEELPMEYRLKSGTVDVQAPPKQSVYVPEVIEIQRQRVFIEKRLEDKWIKESASDDPVLITAESSTIRTHENTQVIEHRGLLKSLLFGPARREAALPAPTEQFRGALQSPSSAPALAAPRSRPAPPALAAPIAEPLQVEYQPVEAMSGRSLVKLLRGR